MDGTFSRLNMSKQVREMEEQRLKRRKRDLNVMIFHHLLDHGLVSTAAALDRETNMPLKEYELCENLDLEMMLAEYDIVQYAKFKKFPELVTTKETGESTLAKSILPRRPSRSSQCRFPPIVSPSTVQAESGGKGLAFNMPATQKQDPQTVRGRFPNPNSSPAEDAPPMFKNEERARTRNHDLLVLIDRYLLDQGYVSTASILDKETNHSLRGFEASESGNLGLILGKYESYHYNKFQKCPEFVRRTTGSGDSKRVKSVLPTRPSCSSQCRFPPIVSPSTFRAKGGAKRQASGVQPNLTKELRTVLRKLRDVNFPPAEVPTAKDQLLNPLSNLNLPSEEMKYVAQVISKEICLESCDVLWEDIIGLEDVKRTVKEAIVYPKKFPHLNKGNSFEWKRLLLFGAPGTGKTLIAKAVATDCETNFINFCTCNVGCGYKDEPEKLVKLLFELVKYYAPCTLFLDEVDSVMCQREAGEDDDNEFRCRVRTEMIIQLDQLAKSEKLILVIASSDFPWKLDNSLLKRFEKRVLVRLPCYTARRDMVSQWLPPISQIGGLKLEATLDLERLAEELKEYSGSDIELVCRQVAMIPVRKVFENLEWLTNADGPPEIKLDSVNTDDFLEVLTDTKPSAKGYAKKFRSWERQFKSV